MLKRDKLLFFISIGLIASCSVDQTNLSKKYEEKSVTIVGAQTYNLVRENLYDSLTTWVNNKFLAVEAETRYPYSIDSLLCFNDMGDRFVGCRHLYVNIPKASADELQFYYGEKIDGNWYFFSGATVIIPRSMVKSHFESKPLSYQQLHEIALKEIFFGYLDSFGNINEDWFIKHFENVGMCAECKTREDFQRNIVAGAAALWSTRDTTQPIKRLDKSTNLHP